MSSNLLIYLALTSIIYSSPGHSCCCVVWVSAAIAAAWLRHRTDYCAFFLGRFEPHRLSGSCGHSCVATWGTWPMWPQLCGHSYWCVCYCFPESYAFVFRHNWRFNYWPQFHDRQKPHPTPSPSPPKLRKTRMWYCHAKSTSPKSIRCFLNLHVTYIPN